jgi:membrane-associated phospholipid phosphatase
MRLIFYRLHSTVKGCFQGWNLVAHLIATGFTYLIVVSGLDWSFFLFAHNASLRYYFFPAIIIGALLPVIGPLIVLLVGSLKKHQKTMNTAWALGQAAMLGLFVSAAYKFFTGRLQPNLNDQLVDISHQFRFGFFRGGVFWGWPSSHTTIAFAMAVALIYLYKKNKTVTVLALLYAFFIGIGVAATSIHWLSEFVAGAIIGSVIGWQVGKSFQTRLLSLK